MPKNPSWSTLPLPERPEDRRISDWLHRELRSAISENRLSAGARLPSSRSPAVQLGISRGTVSAGLVSGGLQAGFGALSPGELGAAIHAVGRIL